MDNVQVSDNASIDKLRNFGPKTQCWLKELDIHTLSDLRKWDYIDVYKALRVRGYPANRLFLYAMWGALHDVDWRFVPQDVKDNFAKQIKTSKL